MSGQWAIFKSRNGLVQCSIDEAEGCLQVYITKLAKLLQTQASDPAAAQLLKDLISLRRVNLAKVARFSCWHWVLYAWNVEALQSMPVSAQPGLARSVRLLVSPQNGISSSL